MRIAVCTDAWHPQINGVVRSISTTASQLVLRGHEVELITPQQFRTVPMPGYREIRLAVIPRPGVRRALNTFAPEIVHIATEGPIGWAARAWCLARGVPFTTAFHTRFPDYAAVRTGIDAERFWPLVRRFHAPARIVLASTPALVRELAERGLPQGRLWSRGIDHNLFRPGCEPLPEIATLPGPVALYVGRVSTEKNLPAFLDVKGPYVKVVVGDGPDLDRLRAAYPQVHFLGARSGQELARAYCSADVMVFPSRTDTFGLVMIEALACGLPVAAFPVPGPLDIIGSDGRGPDGTLPMTIGALDEDLEIAIARASRCDRQGAAVHGASFSWERATDQFELALLEAGEPILAFAPPISVAVSA